VTAGLEPTSPEIDRVATAERRADLLSSFYVDTNLGTASPVTGAASSRPAVGSATAVRSAQPRPGGRRSGESSGKIGHSAPPSRSMILPVI
jgi:hypothetical protein